MILFIDPLYSGKHEAANHYFKERGLDFNTLQVIEDAGAVAFETPRQNLTPDALGSIAKEYAKADVVLMTEVGSGLVPVDPDERAAREAAGRLSCLLAKEADEVYRVLCGIAKRLK